MDRTLTLRALVWLSTRTDKRSRMCMGLGGAYTLERTCMCARVVHVRACLHTHTHTHTRKHLYKEVDQQGWYTSAMVLSPTSLLCRWA